MRHAERISIYWFLCLSTGLKNACNPEKNIICKIQPDIFNHIYTEIFIAMETDKILLCCAILYNITGKKGEKE